jgi:hypothetical protein
MKYIIILFLLFKIAVSNPSNNYNGMIIRNTGLRFLLSCNYKKYKNSLVHFTSILNNKLHNIYDNSQIKCAEYYTLSEDDREFIETILGLIV